MTSSASASRRDSASPSVVAALPLSDVRAVGAALADALLPLDAFPDEFPTDDPLEETPRGVVLH